MNGTYVRFSGTAYLNASKRYTIGAVYVESTRNDGLTVGMVDPNGTAYSPMPVVPFLSMPASTVDTVMGPDPDVLSFVRSFDLFKTHEELVAEPRNASFAKDTSRLALVNFDISDDAGGSLPRDHRYVQNCNILSSQRA